MIRYYCKKDGYYTGGAEDVNCPVCGNRADVVNVIAKVGKFANGGK